jgi:hypothetical protein
MLQLIIVKEDTDFMLIFQMCTVLQVSQFSYETNKQYNLNIKHIENMYANLNKLDVYSFESDTDNVLKTESERTVVINP